MGTPHRNLVQIAINHVSIQFALRRSEFLRRLDVFFSAKNAENDCGLTVKKPVNIRIT
jgi:hypothetical protein